MRDILWLPFAQMQTAPPSLEVVQTQGATLTLEDGRELIDSIASWWTACHGYNHPHIVQAIQAQAAVLPHVMMAGIVHPQAKKLASRLVQLLPGDLNHVFFSESGSVAVEVAMKMALQYWMHLNEPQRQHFICFENGYHGDTFFTMSVCDPVEGYHKHFHPVLPKQHCLPLPTDEEQLARFEKWLAQHAHTIAALIMEPLVQGCGGMKMHSPAVLKSITELCKKYEILIIMDEIFTGFGRTGTLFAIDQAPMVPDIICLSKALTGGTLPLAVTVAQTKIYNAFLDESFDKALMHSSTFMGSALGCAAANASLDLFENEPRLNQIKHIETTLQTQWEPLKEIKGVKAVHIKGAIGVIQFENSNSEMLDAIKEQLLQQGIWSRPFRDILYTTPAFTISDLELNTIVNCFSNCVTDISKRYFQ